MGKENKPQRKSRSTYELFHAMRFMECSKLHLYSLINDGNVVGSSKAFIRTLLNRIEVNVRDLRLLLPSEDIEIIDRDMLDSNVVLQFQNINDMLSELPIEDRDDIENYIEAKIIQNEAQNPNYGT